MKKNIVIPAMALALLLTACQPKSQVFAADDGSVTATLKGTGEWHITRADGTEVVPDYDSMRVVEVSESGHPMTVVYYKGNEQHWLQYFSTMRLRSEGVMIDGRREGRWVFYHANGQVQCEATFVGGKEDGSYRVYRDNGAPYYIGQYANGKPTGIWEVYDQEGNLVQQTEY